jgi:hypothetical protein
MRHHIHWSNWWRMHTAICLDVVSSFVYNTCAAHAVHKLLEDEKPVAPTKENAALDEALSGKRSC